MGPIASHGHLLGLRPRNEANAGACRRWCTMHRPSWASVARTTAGCPAISKDQRPNTGLVQPRGLRTGGGRTP